MLHISYSLSSEFIYNEEVWFDSELDSICIFDAEKINYKLNELIKKSNKVVVTHAPLLVNLASSSYEKRFFSVEKTILSLKAFEVIGAKISVFHPGSKMLNSFEDSVEKLLLSVYQICDNTYIDLVIENMCGAGTQLLKNIEEIEYFFNKLNYKYKTRITLCIDTCHLFTAGYDLNDFEIVKEVTEKLRKLPLTTFHINDSKFPFNSKKDRHERINNGFLKTFFEKKYFLYMVKELKPKYLIFETPFDIIVSKKEVINLKNELHNE